jgi:hypothetical protein
MTEYTQAQLRELETIGCGLGEEEGEGCATRGHHPGCLSTCEAAPNPPPTPAPHDPLPVDHPVSN